jgi:hypothetical protein
MFISNLHIPYKKNVLFVDLIDFAQFFNFNARDIQRLEDINEIIIKALLGDDDCLDVLEELSDSALYKPTKADKKRN